MNFCIVRWNVKFKNSHVVNLTSTTQPHDDVIKWKHFLRCWPFMWGIHRSPVNSLHRGQWRGALIFSLICTWINGWVNKREAGDLRRHRTDYDGILKRTTDMGISFPLLIGNHRLPCNNCPSVAFINKRCYYPSVAFINKRCYYPSVAFINKRCYYQSLHS